MFTQSSRPWPIAWLMIIILMACSGIPPAPSQLTVEPNPVTPTVVEFGLAQPTALPSETIPQPTTPPAMLAGEGTSTPIGVAQSIPAPTVAVEQVAPLPAEIVAVTEIPAPSPLDAGEVPAETPTQAELGPAEITARCAEIEANWGNNWPVVLEALTQLLAAQQNCGQEAAVSKKYAAHFSYAVSLESQGDPEAAVGHYQAALRLDPRRQEAIKALRRLNALPEPTPPACLAGLPPLPDPAPPGPPDLTQFVTAQGNQLQLNGQPFKVKGVNYYPRQAPWYDFLEQANPADMATELDLIQQAGFNTIRVFLRYEPLFTCRPEEAMPQEATFAKVDTLFQLARERNLKLLVTLNDLPDLTFRPLYTDWAHYDAQTSYIIRRYRNEPSILAWDLRNEGDLDYGARPGDEVYFSQADVLAWLAHVSELVRANDPYHLLTAGWWGDPTVTAPFVDILSFHHWEEADQLRARLADYQQRTNQPLLLQEVGYHSWAEAPGEGRNGPGQADILGRVIGVAEAENISGWLVWTAFDFEPAAGQPASPEHFFGLWQVDLTPKPALEALPLR